MAEERKLIDPLIHNVTVDKETGLINPIRMLKEEKDDPNTRKYLILYIGEDDDGNDLKSYEIMVGREDTYKFIRGIIDNIDVHESKVISENMTLKDAGSVYEFMKHMEIYFVDGSFDIEDYNYDIEN